jgi:hypothetical protein
MRRCRGCRDDGRDLKPMPVVREAVSGAAGRVSATLLLGQAPIVVLVRSPPLGRARGRRRHPDHRRHQERRSRSVHASPRHHFAYAGESVARAISHACCAPRREQLHATARSSTIDGAGYRGTSALIWQTRAAFPQGIWVPPRCAFIRDPSPRHTESRPGPSRYTAMSATQFNGLWKD